MANLNDIPSAYATVTPSNTVRQGPMMGVVCSVAGLFEFRTPTMTSFEQTNLVVGQELYGQFELIGTNTTATVLRIIP